MLLSDIVALIHLSNKAGGFGFVGNDDVDCFAFFLLFVELASERDDVGHVGHPCLIESFGGVRAFPCHDLAPVGLEMMEYTFDGAVGVTNIFFIEFFGVLFFNAVKDALHAEIGDRLLQVKFFVSSWKVSISRGVDVAVILLLMVSG